MKLKDFGILTDENISPELVKWLRDKGFEVKDVKEMLLQGTTDQILLTLSFEENRIIFTHDSDFGKMIYTQSAQFVGIIYLRPGHFQSHVHLNTLEKIISQEMDFVPPFILVAENNQTTIRLRLKTLS